MLTLQIASNWCFLWNYWFCLILKIFFNFLMLFFRSSHIFFNFSSFVIFQATNKKIKINQRFEKKIEINQRLEIDDWNLNFVKFFKYETDQKTCKSFVFVNLNKQIIVLIVFVFHNCDLRNFIVLENFHRNCDLKHFIVFENIKKFEHFLNDDEIIV